MQVIRFNSDNYESESFVKQDEEGIKFTINYSVFQYRMNSLCETIEKYLNIECIPFYQNYLDDEFMFYKL